MSLAEVTKSNSLFLEPLHAPVILWLLMCFLSSKLTVSNSDTDNSGTPYNKSNTIFLSYVEMSGYISFTDTKWIQTSRYMLLREIFYA